MKKLKNILDAIQQVDKLKHFVLGTFLYALGTFLFTPYVGVIFTVVGGALKELIWDKILEKGAPEPLDYFMTILPAIILFLSQLQ